VRGVLLGGVALAALLTGCDDGGQQDEVSAPPPSTGPTTSPPASSTVDATATSVPAASSGSTTGDTATSTTETSPVVRVFDRQAMQEAVLGILTDSYRLDEVSDVRCPAGQSVEPGATFDCTVEVGGEQQSVPITVTSEQGDYEVGLPEPE
jgi:hypothetical protein